MGRCSRSSCGASPRGLTRPVRRHRPAGAPRLGGRSAPAPASPPSCRCGSKTGVRWSTAARARLPRPRGLRRSRAFSTRASAAASSMRFLADLPAASTPAAERRVPHLRLRRPALRAAGGARRRAGARAAPAPAPGHHFVAGCADERPPCGAQARLVLRSRQHAARRRHAAFGPTNRAMTAVHRRASRHPARRPRRACASTTGIATARRCSAWCAITACAAHFLDQTHRLPGLEERLRCQRPDRAALKRLRDR